MPTIVDIDALAQDGRVRIGGQEHAVKPISVKMLRKLQSGEGDNVERLFAVILDRAPTISREMLEDLSLAQLEGIIDVSMEGLKKVEDAAPNGDGPTSNTSA